MAIPRSDRRGFDFKCDFGAVFASPHQLAPAAAPPRDFLAELPALIVAGAVFLGQWGPAQPPSAALLGDAEPLPPYFHLLLVPLLIAWIGALALSRGLMSRFLSTKTLVLGGFISYSLYMTHLVWFGLWRAGMNAVGIEGGALYAIATAGLVAGALVIAWLMWRFVEEPAREWMRGLSGARRTPTEEAGEATWRPSRRRAVALVPSCQSSRSPSYEQIRRRSRSRNPELPGADRRWPSSLQFGRHWCRCV